MNYSYKEMERVCYEWADLVELEESKKALRQLAHNYKIAAEAESFETLETISVHID